MFEYFSTLFFTNSQFINFEDLLEGCISVREGPEEED